MPHGTIRASTLKTVIPLIAKRFNCGEDEAIDMFYESRVGDCYADDATGLYGQSAYYVAGLFFDEKERGGASRFGGRCSSPTLMYSEKDDKNE